MGTRGTFDLPRYGYQSTNGARRAFARKFDKACDLDEPIIRLLAHQSVGCSDMLDRMFEASHQREVIAQHSVA